MKKNLMFYLLLSTAAVMAQPKLEDGIKFELQHVSSPIRVG